jgi:hypothetical protein
MTSLQIFMFAIALPALIGLIVWGVIVDVKQSRFVAWLAQFDNDPLP